MEGILRAELSRKMSHQIVKKERELVMVRASVALAVLVVGISVSAGFAQAPTTPNVGPPGPPPNGEQLYTENCVECHGPEGDAVPDVDLGHGRFRRATTDPELVGIVLRGIPNTAMPPNNFTEAQASAIVQFLRMKARRAAATAGNGANGQAIFSGKGNCTSCHRINGVGARIGPDLSEIGRLRHSTEIEQSIVDPDAMIVPSIRFVRVVKRDGATITGRLLNQDVFTVQLLDSKEQLRSMQRADLKEFTFIDKSPMPSYRGKLSASEITDLVSYLVSLQGGAQ
jgi:putative heme-binding domain-containing protein